MNDRVRRYAGFCDSAFGRKLMEREAEYVRRELLGYRRVLDVGCGIGVLEQKLPDLDMVGLDSSAEMLCEAGARCPNPFVLGQAARLGFEDGSFDAVLFVTSLEFIDDYRPAIDEAARVLRPGGKLLIMMLNPESGYFAAHHQREGSYFRQIKHIDLREVLDYVCRQFSATGEYFLGIAGEDVFDTGDKALASLYVIRGQKKP